MQGAFAAVIPGVELVVGWFLVGVGGAGRPRLLRWLSDIDRRAGRRWDAAVVDGGRDRQEAAPLRPLQVQGRAAGFLGHRETIGLPAYGERAGAGFGQGGLVIGDHRDIQRTSAIPARGGLQVDLGLGNGLADGGRGDAVDCAVRRDHAGNHLNGGIALRPAGD